MTLDEEANRLRIELVRLGEGHGRRYPPGMKKQILAWVERARRAGMKPSECGARLGLLPRQLSSWKAQLQAPHVLKAQPPKKFAAVELDEEASTATASIAFVAPSGFRIEGITVAQAVELMRALA